MKTAIFYKLLPVVWILYIIVVGATILSSHIFNFLDGYFIGFGVGMLICSLVMLIDFYYIEFFRKYLELYKNLIQKGLELMRKKDTEILGLELKLKGYKKWK